MSRQSTSILVASIAAAALGLSQGAFATDATAPAAATPPAPPAPPAAPAPMSAPESPDAIIARMEARHKQMAEERERRYEELRNRASQLGFEMPEMPPWEPGERAGMPSPDYAPWITPEERNALREKRWQETRTRAAEHGIELPEMPPWKAAEERRKEMKARFDKFRETMDALNQEQRQAIEQVIGEMPDFGEMPEFGTMPSRPGGMGPGWHGQSRCPHGSKPCNHPRPGYPVPMGAPGMMPPPAAEAPAQPTPAPAN
ncbi:hypothetical protein [Thiorhodovibrio frisius]|uniref:LTXXQ motif protein n=1 Tax=Thiorhodovibrio frisius TaxID=631362 RepID=H8Z749_9GAMM|nr:hypothetical protein [Thiorhodovibrio frisius]EIC20848.1 hypothetical protein Thi970DRAFT_04514 [Thiorhodovibrio frisius]WPL21900.1 hypothetical protein Thiofri_02037 [Thiorhodovibrio frisius]